MLRVHRAQQGALGWQDSIQCDLRIVAQIRHQVIAQAVRDSEVRSKSPKQANNLVRAEDLVLQGSKEVVRLSDS